MNVQDIMQRWIPRETNTQAGMQWWNEKAAHFGAQSLPTAESSLGMRLIQGEGMVHPGDRVLDVGCGGGRFCFALEKMGADALGVDFSPNMIEECERNKAAIDSHAMFAVCNWHEVDIDKNGWTKQFDLVLAHMTPAIVSAETFLKLSLASRNWCLMVKPTRRSNTVLDGLYQIIGAEQEARVLNETIAYAFDLLWLNGMNPKLEYEEQDWDNSQPLEKAIREYIPRVAYSHKLTQKDKDAMIEYLHSISVNGMVHETSHSLIAAMYWQV